MTRLSAATINHLTAEEALAELFETPLEHRLAFHLDIALYAQAEAENDYRIAADELADSVAEAERLSAVLGGTLDDLEAANRELESTREELSDALDEVNYAHNERDALQARVAALEAELSGSVA